MSAAQLGSLDEVATTHGHFRLDTRSADAGGRLQSASYGGPHLVTACADRFHFSEESKWGSADRELVVAWQRMDNADNTRRLRREAEVFLETAAQLFRNKRYPQMLRHCYLALQTAMEASFLATHGGPAPASVNLVVIGQALGRPWSDEQRDLMVELTECARAIGGGNGQSVAEICTKEGCLRSLTLTGNLIADLR